MTAASTGAGDHQRQKDLTRDECAQTMSENQSLTPGRLWQTLAFGRLQTFSGRVLLHRGGLGSVPAPIATLAPSPECLRDRGRIGRTRVDGSERLGATQPSV